MTGLLRCYFYNIGYCKENTNCIYLHSKDDCETSCTEETCLKRHRQKCKKLKVYFYLRNL